MILRKAPRQDPPTTWNEPPSNTELAKTLQTVSDHLWAHGADRFRAEAYRRAAMTVEKMKEPVWHVYESEGMEGLTELPSVGESIARVLQKLVRGERWALLDRLQANDDAEHAFASVPNIGPKLAKRLHDELGINSLADLQAAAWDGRLRQLNGFGEKRIRAVRESLAARGRIAPPSEELDHASIDLTREVPIGDLLDIDDEYRFQAARSSLPRVAPYRFNHSGDAWLPILHTTRDGQRYTAMYSNSEHAHAMGTTNDWVVIFVESDTDHPATGKWTIITSRFGKLRGRRIVRGREDECWEYYKKRDENGNAK